MILMLWSIFIYVVTHVFQEEKVGRERREVIDPNMLAKNMFYHIKLVQLWLVELFVPKSEGFDCAYLILYSFDGIILFVKSIINDGVPAGIVPRY